MAQQSFFQAAIAVGADPDKHLPQSHITNGSVDPGNVLKEIIDLAINDLAACNPTATVFIICEALTFEEFYVTIIVIAIANPYT
ncbi:hypothetical protein [Endozoicomonas sp. GU-1]|uniref:hypothetical protein n=1 Tax=Endozoicomonas sp. GU-1 TaxID=3009078 RepID=UPI0022B3E8BC|nr:hypothetical protein [Endozoicomonas sp. GU-1]WBA79750.1 hypothetical protein O2T12_15410 [Endozoicomonas sp. GU-1]WBA87335.1 hypothetical protein O3276_04680 [Endozoicomonas sp. GU-1]